MNFYKSNRKVSPVVTCSFLLFNDILIHTVEETGDVVNDLKGRLLNRRGKYCPTKFCLDYTTGINPEPSL